MLYARRTLLLTGGEHGFPRCVIAAADRGSECLKVPYFLHLTLPYLTLPYSTANYEVLHFNTSHRKEKRT